VVKGVLKKVNTIFKKAREPSRGAQGQTKKIAIGNCLMAALAVFKMKILSLLQLMKV